MVLSADRRLPCGTDVNMHTKALTERRGFSNVHLLECKMDDPTAQDASDVCCRTAPAGAAPFCWVCIRGSAEELCAAALCHSRLW